MNDHKTLIYLARAVRGDPPTAIDFDALPEPYKTIALEVATTPTNKTDALRNVAGANGIDADELIGQIGKVSADDDPNALPIPIVTADQLLTKNFPAPVWAIPNLLPTGLTIVAGAPKLGKSWLALQIAQAIASGGVALGEQVQRGPVLYLALEDSERRLQERMRQQGWSRGLDADFLAVGEFKTKVGDLKNGGGKKLAQQIRARGYRACFVDTLSRAIEGDQNDVQQMTKGLTPLQEIAHDTNTAIVLIDHHRKVSKNGGSDTDAIGDILGSTAKGAMCDTTWGLYRERGKVGAKLAITGRDVDEKTLALKMDWLTGVWQVEGDYAKVKISEARQEILDTLKRLNKATLKDIYSSTGQDKGNTLRRLNDMINDGKIQSFKIGKDIYYSL